MWRGRPQFRHNLLSLFESIANVWPGRYISTPFCLRLAAAVAGVLILGSLPMLLAAQPPGPSLLLHGRPDVASNPPEVQAYLSVLDRASAYALTDLERDAFRLQEAGTPVDTFEVTPTDVGLAVVLVVDRGGISEAGDQRIRAATALVREFVARLTIAGAANDDVLAIIGVGQDGVLEPQENFSHDPVDTNLVLNALVLMENDAVRGGTPLYEGLDEALSLLTHNHDARIREVLSRRRKLIVVFSDGVDANFSDEAREQDIIRKAVAEDVSIYTIGIAQPGGSPRGGDNLKMLAAQTGGLYQLHDGGEPALIRTLDLFDRLVTQRQQYVLSYVSHLPKGVYTLDVSVDTDLGSAELARDFDALLEMPRLSLAPLVPPQDNFRVPFSRSAAALTLTLRVAITAPDGAPRAPSSVRYFANGDQIGESHSPPDFAFVWSLSDLYAVNAAPEMETFTLSAEARDPYLQRVYSTDVPLKVAVTWDAPPLGARSASWLVENLWLLLILLFLLLGMALLAFMLLRTRNELAQRVFSEASSVLKSVTRSLGDASQRSPGKLIIQRGSNKGREFRLSAQVTKVGRDLQFSDFSLDDEFISNPHFSIHREGTQFYITDEGSTNGTRLNARLLAAHRRTPLPADALIEVGQTRLQFKQLGLATRPLGAFLGGRRKKPAPGSSGEPVVVAPPPHPEVTSNPYVTRPVLEDPPPSQPATANPYATRPGRDSGAADDAAASNSSGDAYATRPVED